MKNKFFIFNSALEHLFKNILKNQSMKINNEK